MFETLIRLNPSMIPKYQQIIEFKENPQVRLKKNSISLRENENCFFFNYRLVSVKYSVV